MVKDRFVADTVAGPADLAQELGASGIEQPGISRVLQLVNEMSSMVFLVLLAKGTPTGEAGAAANPVMAEGVDEIVQRVAERNGFSEEEIREALVLLRNGSFERDLASVAAETSRAAGQMPFALSRSVQEALRDPLRVFGFAIAMALDLRELPVEGADLNPQEFERIVRGGVASPGRNYPLFDHTFAALYKIEPINVLKNWLLGVTERRSVQLALIVFARAHGVELEPADVEAARETLRQGNLTPAIVQGIQYFRRQHADRFPDILAMLA